MSEIERSDYIGKKISQINYHLSFKNIIHIGCYLSVSPIIRCSDHDSVRFLWGRSLLYHRLFVSFTGNHVKRRIMYTLSVCEAKRCFLKKRCCTIQMRAHLKGPRRFTVCLLNVETALGDNRRFFEKRVGQYFSELIVLDEYHQCQAQCDFGNIVPDFFAVILTLELLLRGPGIISYALQYR